MRENTAQNNSEYGDFWLDFGKDMLFYETFLLNPFVPNAPFVYPLKTSENSKVFWCFQGVEKGYIGNEWVNIGPTKLTRKIWRHYLLILTFDHV